jgi:hypothetical protein
VTSPRPRTRRLRTAAGLAVAGLAAALTLTGCSYTNQITTEKEYNSSDGVGGHIGNIKAINFLIVSEAKGDPGALAGALQNTDSQDETVTIALGDDDHATVAVPGNSTVLLNAPGGNSDTNKKVVFDAIPEPPGAVVEVTVTTKNAGSVTLDVPVLDGTLPEYAGLVPDATS